ncbi:hypothetical protein QQS45_08485 [Alteriqipengyuania flavescens]|uniref:hypothetical protein n=1 Tax=Alteriqipengyuania flavescens TaxID=3053610 RepID=UPI0025B56B54|nr:hypothetical protein [Alteriqipengyuania flavescens]WJY17684.1 hypothetical protein QQW98_08480 [Alteriqipengyuania flavescens]WJY23627.1 hypothetical protein QQS45_08485 [Alteriqipengyuania flavescens]
MTRHDETAGAYALITWGGGAAVELRFNGTETLSVFVQGDEATALVDAIEAAPTDDLELSMAWVFADYREVATTVAA